MATNVRTISKRQLPAAAPLPQPFDPSTFPDIYGMGVVGSCMEPLFPNGCKIKCSKSEPYQQGDVVTVWFKPELIRPGATQAMIKRMIMMPPPWVKSFPYKDNPKSDVLALLMLGTEDRPDEMLRVRCCDVIAVHKVLGLLRPEEIAPAPRRSRRSAALSQVSP